MLIFQKLTSTLTQSRPTRFARFLGKDVSFRDALTYIARYSYALQHDITTKKRVGVLMHHSPHIFYSFFALANTGNVMVPLPPEWSDEELAEVIKELGVSALLITESLKSRAKDLLRKEHLAIPLFEVDNKKFGQFDSTYKAPTGVSLKDTDSVLLLPSGEKRKKRRWISYSHQMIEAQALAAKFAIKNTAADTFFSYRSSPLSPVSLLHVGILPLLNGSSVFLSDTTAPTDLMMELHEGKVSRVYATLTHLEELDLIGRDMELKLPWLKAFNVIKNGASASLYQRMQARFPKVPLLQGYGGVENGFAVSWMTRDQEFGNHCGSVLPGMTVRLLNMVGADLKTNSNQIGEVVVSGKGVTSGYVNSPKDQKLNFRGKSFFSGDLARIDKEGMLRFVGKKEYWPIRDGNFLDVCALVEFVKECPGIADAVYLGAKSRSGKNIGVLAMEKSPNGVTNAPTIQTAFEPKFSKDLHPEHLLFLPVLPRNEWGQVLHHDILGPLEGVI